MTLEFSAALEAHKGMGICPADVRQFAVAVVEEAVKAAPECRWSIQARSHMATPGPMTAMIMNQHAATGDRDEQRAILRAILPLLLEFTPRQKRHNRELVLNQIIARGEPCKQLFVLLTDLVIFAAQTPVSDPEPKGTTRARNVSGIHIIFGR